MTSTCRHCGERIVLVNWSMGPGWTHQPEGAQDQHVYCHTSHAAEPEPEPEPAARCPHCGCTSGCALCQRVSTQEAWTT